MKPGFFGIYPAGRVDFLTQSAQRGAQRAQRGWSKIEVLQSYLNRISTGQLKSGKRGLVRLSSLNNVTANFKIPFSRR